MQSVNSQKTSTETSSPLHTADDDAIASADAARVLMGARSQTYSAMPTVNLYLPLLLILLAFAGCESEVDEKYIYKDRIHAPGVTTEETPWKEVIYKKGDFYFYPRFYSLTRSYPEPHSRLLIYSTAQKEIYLESMVLASAQGTYSDQIAFERTFAIDGFNERRAANYVGIPLFTSENTDLSGYWAEGDIKVTLSYVDSSGDPDEITFEFELWKGQK